MSKWPADNTASLKNYYGNPTGKNGQVSPAWAAASLVMVPIPWECFLSWDTKTRYRAVRVHVKVAPALTRIFAELAKRTPQEIRAAGLHLCGGTFNYRLKRGLNSLSTHAFGAAIDFDPERNGLGDKTPELAKHPWVIEAFAREGAVWGGKFSRPDGMHFQFAT